MMTVSTSKV